MESLLRRIPQVSKIVEKFRGRYPEEIIKRAAREVTERYREKIKRGELSSVEGIYEDIERRIAQLLRPNLRKVINATGIVINTNLGRAPLHREVLKHIEEVALGYSNLEYDLCEGKRGSRNSHIEEILCDLTGAEASFVVNNNAGAVYLVLNTLAFGREVIVSRGELVEIGGSFRIPDIMRSSGATLVEVGTTNKTRISDYERAISENTALLMKVHRSNFYMEGFTEEVSLEDLVSLGKRRGLLTYYDAGSGLLIDLPFAAGEPSLRRCIETGLDLVSASGDKLLGGPQAGIILGKRELIEKIKRNPMSRALRIDKLTLAGLEKTLRLYAEGRHEEVPVVRMLTEDEESIRRRARRLKRLLRGIEGVRFEVVKDRAKPGGGSLPRLELPTYCLAVIHPKFSAQELSKRLRYSEPPVIGKIERDTFLLDLRSVPDEELPLLRSSLRSALGV